MRVSQYCAERQNVKMRAQRMSSRLGQSFRREMLATTLERDGKPTDALAEFEKVLEQQPNRYNAIAGAAQNAKRVGNEQKAVHYSEQLLKLTEHADSPRPEIGEAKRILGR